MLPSRFAGALTGKSRPMAEAVQNSCKHILCSANDRAIAEGHCLIACPPQPHLAASTCKVVRAPDNRCIPAQGRPSSPRPLASVHVSFPDTAKRSPLNVLARFSCACRICDCTGWRGWKVGLLCSLGVHTYFGVRVYVIRFPTC